MELKSPSPSAIEERKETIMVDNRITEATCNLLNSLRETNKALANSAVEAQQRNVAFAQSVLENGIEVLKSHAESTRTLTQQFLEQARKRPDWQEGFQTVVENTVTAQQRTLTFAQSVFENGIEVLKSQVAGTRTLMQELEQQAHKQQDAFGALAHESLDVSLHFLRAPLPSYPQAPAAAQTAACQALENWQHASRQGFESWQRASRSAQSTAQKATPYAQDAAETITQ